MRTIGEGGCHVVYDTGDGKVLKRPKGVWKLLCDYSDMAKDAFFAGKYFGEYLWPTEVLPDDPESPASYFLIQPLLPRYETLTVEMVRKDSELARQFEDILDRNEKLYAETGRAFDFFGLEGMVEAFAAGDGPTEGWSLEELLRKAFASAMANVFLSKEIEGNPSISNLLVIDKADGKAIRIVDPTLTDERSHNLEAQAFAFCCNGLNRRYLRLLFEKEILLEDGGKSV
jgi:hypothetical protein